MSNKDKTINLLSNLGKRIGEDLLLEMLDFYNVDSLQDIPEDKVWEFWRGRTARLSMRCKIFNCDRKRGNQCCFYCADKTKCYNSCKNDPAICGCVREENNC